MVTVVKLSINKLLARCLILALGVFAFSLSTTALAVDSYRYAHVTIETPWMIFLFLLVIVLMPFIVMAILYWRYAFQKEKPEAPDVE